MKYGLECEFFVAKKDVRPFELIGGLSHELTPDSCGFLAEARGQPYNSIEEAVFSLMANIYKLEQAAVTLNVELIKLPNADVPYSEVMKSRRQFAKDLIKFQNLYGHECHVEKKKKTAGIHISFTDEREFNYSQIDTEKCKTERKFTYQPNWDWVQVFRTLDKAFAKEIKEARRRPGFYELKPDGRIEYRSLPNTVDLMKIIEVLKT